MAQFSTISPDNLFRLIGTPRARHLIDVTLDEDFASDSKPIPTAQRWPFTQLTELSLAIQGQHVVVICQKGLKLSYGAAALLRTHGVTAEVLEGGNAGWAAAGLPRLPVEKLSEDFPGTLWVTRNRPKIDRIACPWFLRRFVDPTARFLFVPASEVLAVAKKFSATAFDVPEARWTHIGEHCSFDTMIDGFQMRTEALDRMATVIRSADTNRHDLAPEAAGLLAVSVGLSRAYRDDLEQLDAGLVLYDALYRWARDGFDESHYWQETPE